MNTHTYLTAIPARQMLERQDFNRAKMLYIRIQTAVFNILADADRLFTWHTENELRDCVDPLP